MFPSPLEYVDPGYFGVKIVGFWCILSCILLILMSQTVLNKRIMSIEER